jgi:transposase
MDKVIAIGIDLANNTVSLHGQNEQDTARRFRAMGHDARIIAPKCATKFRQKQKDDANDARAICEA